VLQHYAREWARQHDIVVDVAVERLDDSKLSLEAEQALLRIAQEALANVARHSAAQHVRLELVRRDDTIELSIGDNGSGFETSDATRLGYGLLHMRERAAALGGGLSVASTPGRGTLVICRVTAQGCGR
jgi:signal transduction histidine kinase